MSAPVHSSRQLVSGDRRLWFFTGFVELLLPATTIPGDMKGLYCDETIGEKTKGGTP
ncbi:MAG: hypothetical protein ACLFM1_11055 [Bacteroidales bacterium]